MILIDVTEADIREGVIADCHSCPVAIAASRATGQECSVYSHNWNLCLSVAHLIIELPIEVSYFVMEFDDQDRGAGCKPKIGLHLPPAMKPFAFKIPNLDDPKWKEKCYGCENLFQPAELDDEGYCEECQNLTRSAT